MRTDLLRRGLLLTALLIWGARPLLPMLVHPDDSARTPQSRTASRDRLPENPLSALHEWLASTETTLKTLPIKDRENFLQHLEKMKGNFAKLVQRPLQKIDGNGSAAEFLQGPDADRFYQGLETLYKEKSRLEKNILHNLETYGLKV